MLYKLAKYFCCNRFSEHKYLSVNNLKSCIFLFFLSLYLNFNFLSISLAQAQADNLILFSHKKELNFIDGLSLALYCRVSAAMNVYKEKCFLDLSKIIDNSINNNLVIKDLQDNYNLLLATKADLDNLKIDVQKIKNSNRIYSNNTYKNSYIVNSDSTNISLSNIYSTNTSESFAFYDKDINDGHLLSLVKNISPDISKLIKYNNGQEFLGVANKIDNSEYKVILSGKAKIEVSAEYGAIKTGDYITVSPNFPGVGAKLAGSGYSLGIALNDDLGSGKVFMLIRPQYINK